MASTFPSHNCIQVNNFEYARHNLITECRTIHYYIHLRQHLSLKISCNDVERVECVLKVCFTEYCTILKIVLKTLHL